MCIYLQFFFPPFTFIERQSMGTRSKRRGGKKKKRFACRKILSIFIRTHTSTEKKKKKGICGKKRVEGYTRIYFFPRRRRRPRNSLRRTIPRKLAE